MTREDRERAVADTAPTDLFINGRWRPSQAGRTFDVEDPSTGTVLRAVADANVEDGLAALDAASAAQAGWARFPPRERGEILRRAYELMMERQEDLALLMTLEMGKPLAESRSEIAYAAEFFRWFGEEAVRIDGGFATAPSGSGRVLVMRQPVGPALLITPWNFPAAMGTRKIGPAVAAGCTMVLKPARLTPLSMLALTGILAECGLPEGVLNVLPTSRSAPLMEPLIRDGRARKLSFTGSTEVGQLLLAQCAEHVLRTSMELGGNAPFLVFADADLDEAVRGAMIAKMRNIGEACTAANRFYVHADIVDEFARRFADQMGALRIGRGSEEGVQVGPLIEATARERVQRLVGDALARGAEVLVGGEPVDGAGYFYHPTVLRDVPRDAEIAHTEIFGPVAAIVSFTDERQVMTVANDSPFGLVGYVYTSDIGRALRVCEQLEVGMVGLNQGVVSNPAAPFGGIKHSGLGREGGTAGIEEFLETKYVAIAT